MKVIGENEVRIQLKESTGPAGPAGADGKDGTSVTHSWRGTTLTVTSASGTSSADLKGEKGEPGKDGKDGATGLVGPAGADGKDGAPGADGEDGGYYSPSVDAEGNLTWMPSKTGMPGVAGANIRGPEGPKGEAGQDGATGSEGKQGATGPSGADGEDGGYYTPAVDNDGNLTWTASKADMPDVPGVNIKGPAGSIDNLPIASPTTLGGVMPAAKTDEMTQQVGVDALGGLWALPGGGEFKSDLICDITTTEPVASISQDVNNKLYRMLLVYVKFQGIGGESNPDGITAGFRQKLIVTLSNGKRFGRTVNVNLIGTSNTPVWHNNFLFHFMKNAVAIALERNEQTRNNAIAIKESSPLEIEDIKNYTGIKKIEFTNEGGKNLLMTTGAQMKAWGLY